MRLSNNTNINVLHVSSAFVVGGVYHVTMTNKTDYKVTEDEYNEVVRHLDEIDQYLSRNKEEEKDTLEKLPEENI